MKGFRRNNLAAIFAVYFIFLYMMPVFFWILFPGSFSSYFVKTQTSPLLTVPLVWITFLFLAVFASFTRGYIRYPHFRVNVGIAILVYLSFSLIFLFVSFELSLIVDGSFRHSNRISDFGMLGYVYYLIKTATELIAIRMLFVDRQLYASRPYQALILTAILVFVAANIIFTIGSGQAISICVALLLGMRIFSFRSYMRLSQFSLSSGMALVSVGVFTVVVGLGVKLGFDAFLSGAGRELVLNYAEKLPARFSVSLYSAHFALSGYEGGFLSPFQASISTLLDRLVTLFGGVSSESLHQNINIVNYNEAFQFPAYRGGASPGPIGTIFYMWPSPIGLILVLVLLSVFKSGICPLLPSNLDWVVVFVSVLMLMRLLESPVLLVQVLDLNFIFFLLFFCSFCLVRIR